jgi:FlaA1/EpsC-like NDP-sugar epimerase
MSDSNNQTIGTRMLDTSNIISIFFGFSFLNTSFYHPIYMTPQAVIGYLFIIYGLLSINKWETGSVTRISHIKWSLILIVIVVIPLQIYSSITKINFIDLNILLVISILNIIADAIVITVLICKKKGLKEGRKND